MAMTPPRGVTAARAAAVTSFVAIVAWLSVVIGIGAINLTRRQWCAAGSACEEFFWFRLLIAAAGGIISFAIVGYGLAAGWKGRRLALLAIAAALVTIGSGVWFWPIISG